MNGAVVAQFVLTRCLVTEADFIAWFAAAQPGARLAYFRGHLGVTLSPEMSDLPEAKRRELQRVACRAWALAEAGEAHLLQRRNAANDISYLIEARPRANSLPAPPRACAASPMRLRHPAQFAA